MTMTNRVCSETRRWRVVLLAVIAIGLVFSSSGRPRAFGGGLVISQVYGAGGNSGATHKNDFVELFNPGSSSVSLAGKSVQYASATGTGNFGGTATQITVLPNVSIGPGQHFLVQEAGGANGSPLPTPDASGNISMAAGAGKVALVDSATSLGCNGGSAACNASQLALIIDLVGYGTGSGGANFYEGSGAAPTLSTTAAAFRRGDGNTDTNNNAADFYAATPNPRNSGAPASTNPTGIGAASPTSAPAGSLVTLTLAVTPGTNPSSTGLTARADLSLIGGSSAQTLYDDGTNGDVSAGDNTFSFQPTVATGTAPGLKSLPVIISDGQGRSATVRINFAVEPAEVTAIHDIQGPGATSPLVGQFVATTGIVTGVKTSGFFIQTPDNAVDASPSTSEAVFVYTGGAPTVTAGNGVRVVGTVQEYVPSTDPYSPSMTEIAPVAITVTDTGNPLPAAIMLTAADTNPAGGLEQMERYEGMRVTVESLTVIAPTGGSVSEASATSTPTGVFYGVITGVSRPFREPGIERPDPLLPGAPSGTPRFDGNPERLRVDSDALVGAPVLDVTSGAVVANLTGPMDYGYRTYTIDPDPGSDPSVTGNISAVAVPFPKINEFTIATFNMERFYDATKGQGDVLLTPEAFAKRLAKASLIIREQMRTPDIIGVEEVENLAALQAIAQQVDSDATAAGAPPPGYQAYLQEGNDPSSIDVGFLVKGTVQVTDAVQVGKDTKFTDPRDGSTDTLNDRPPLVLRADVPDSRGGPSFAVTVIANHLRSLTDVDTDTPDGLYARTKRQLQAEFLANLIQEHQVAGEHVVSVGDYNAFQFNDGYVDVMGTVVGVPAPTNEVLLASADLVDPNLTDLVNLAHPLQRYSYIQDGTAQVLDHILVTSNMQTRIASVAFARCNADFPESLRGNAARPERLSDHDPMVAYFTFPTADLAIAVSGAPNPVQSGSTITYTIPVTNTAKDPALNPVVTDTLPAGITFATASADGWACAASGNTVTCTASVLAPESTATITVSGVVACELPNGAVLANRAALAATTVDPDPTNNTATLETTVSNPAPVVLVKPASPSTLWPVNHNMVNVVVDWDVTDNCGVPSCSVNVTSNEPVNGTGDGNTAADWSIVDAHHVQLRAERSGNGPGRVYTIAVTCADAKGNSSTQTTTVTVPKSQK